MQDGISTEQVLHVARLARLRLDDGELAHYRDQLSGVLALIDEIARLDLAGVAPMEHVPSESSSLRPDVVQASLGPAGLASGDRLNQEQLLVVPPIVELDA
ncbi:glutamyl-tRNA(Gln) amidotransferase, C subunit [Acidimicrobium ferrooxidans DSM 10331]|uniref:Aspartyl/glutamyl-tRNA(Asn/Gln) amidotransferase subunit C n=1 Tax=Acidimicrobium ferrooxidans (strain DSM 10331 / JCM 15462 / NBRC 103882 / ICP) TaxID=525909 RepID=C7M0G5_ACIFD|nr:Asp-tRNA(Asn)/Glu-tRNA(Gln) amidotransferase subunit GatC [Acidimicrobium ferrooxidans]ACU54473.1 glutamyl-tRNA(Gln) amidotransferase, C subunit [Acidimicrobium ferrooxidans DSM 10331]